MLPINLSNLWNYKETTYRQDAITFLSKFAFVPSPANHAKSGCCNVYVLWSHFRILQNQLSCYNNNKKTRSRGLHRCPTIGKVIAKSRFATCLTHLVSVYGVHQPCSFRIDLLGFPPSRARTGRPAVVSGRLRIAPVPHRPRISRALRVSIAKPTRLLITVLFSKGFPVRAGVEIKLLTYCIL